MLLTNDLDVSSNVNLLASRYFYQLRHVKNCRRALPLQATKTLIKSFVVSKVDSCNALLAGNTVLSQNKLQRVLSTAIKIIYGGCKHDHVTPLIRQAALDAHS